MLNTAAISSANKGAEEAVQRLKTARTSNAGKRFNSGLRTKLKGIVGTGARERGAAALALAKRGSALRSAKVASSNDLAKVKAANLAADTTKTAAQRGATPAPAATSQVTAAKSTAGLQANALKSAAATSKIDSMKNSAAGEMAKINAAKAAASMAKKPM